MMKHWFRSLLLAAPFCLSFATVVSAGELENKLVEASSKGEVKTVLALIREGAQINAKGQGEMTALTAAVSAGQAEAVQA